MDILMYYYIILLYLCMFLTGFSYENCRIQVSDFNEMERIRITTEWNY